MPETFIEITGLPELQRFFGVTAPADIKTGVNNGLQSIASAIKDTTTGLAPVRTGFMRSQISVSQTGDTIKAHAAADYSSFVDEGTSRTSAEPFFTKPIEGITTAINMVIEGALAKTGIFNE